MASFASSRAWSLATDSSGLVHDVGINTHYDGSGYVVWARFVHDGAPNVLPASGQAGGPGSRVHVFSTTDPVVISKLQALSGSPFFITQTS